MIIGSHVSFTKNKQLLGSLEEALSYGANTFMFYTGAPQNTKRFDINQELTEKALNLMKDNNINCENIIVHAPYIINLANDDENKYQFSIDFLREEINRCESLKMKYLVLHPGSHVGLGIDKGIDNIIFALNQVLSNTNVKILLETMAGKGTEVGSNFEEIKRIIDGVKNKNNIGVCIDTCHLHDAGYNLNNFSELLNEFDNVIGINYLYCVHVNDSKNPSNSHKDRHENIGYGEIGFDNLINIVYNPLLKNIPKILETPYYDEKAPYKAEILMIKNKVFDNFKK